MPYGATGLVGLSAHLTVAPEHNKSTVPAQLLIMEGLTHALVELIQWNKTVTHTSVQV